MKIAMVVFSSFPLDVRVRREAEAHMEVGNQVDVLCRTSRKEASKEVVNNINVYRLNLKRKRSGKITYLFEYLYFFFWAFFKVTSLHIRKKYDVVHVHNMPNFIVFTSLIPKLFGAKVILDLHDPMPELFASMFSLYDDSFVVKVLKWFEARAMRYANMNITPNIAFRNLFISRGCPHEKIAIVMNSPDEKIFKSDGENKLTSENKNFVIMYHGAVVKRRQYQ
jgi:glycosyltransferase involved in cell wall biosynthesis